MTININIKVRNINHVLRHSLCWTYNYQEEKKMMEEINSSLAPSTVYV
jgi:hypothetical protein